MSDLIPHIDRALFGCEDGSFLPDDDTSIPVSEYRRLLHEVAGPIVRGRVAELESELAAADRAEAERKVECPDSTCPASFVSTTPFDAERQMLSHWLTVHPAVTITR